MTKEELINLKQDIAALSEEDKKERDLYLRGLANGDIQGPPVGYPSIDKPWLQWYSPENIIKNPDVNNNVFDYFMSAAPNNYYVLEYCGKKYKKEDIAAKVEKYTKQFYSMGISNGDTVSFLMLDVPEILFMWMALSRLGATANLIKFDESPERIAFMNNIGDSDYLFVSEVPFLLKNVSESYDYGNNAKSIVSVPITSEMPKKEYINNIKDIMNKTKDSKEKLRAVIKQLNVLKNMNAECKEIIGKNHKFITFSEWNKKYPGTKYTLSNNDSNRTSIIVYTGGTTGKAKGVELSNKNIINMAHSFKFSDFGFDPGKTSLNILPPGPAYYLNATYALMCCGVSVNLIANFDIKEYSSLIDKYKPNIFLSGPILLKQMAEDGVIKDASYVTSPISGGDKLHVAEEEKINNFFREHNSNANVHQGYGESESTAAATYSKDSAYVLGGIGIPLLNVEVGIFDYHTYEEYEPNKTYEKKYNEIGEICITGPTILKGYKDNLEETNRVLRMHSDGKYWLHTDDLGYMDNQGRLFHCGRAKRMLTRSGVKVWLGTIEDVIKRSDYIYDCCCVKFDDDEEREVPIAFIVPNSDFDAKSVQAIDSILRKAQPEAFIPKYYVLIDEIPYTEVNKKVDFKSLESEDIFDSNKYSIQGRIIKKNNKIYKKEK